MKEKRRIAAFISILLFATFVIACEAEQTAEVIEEEIIVEEVIEEEIDEPLFKYIGNTRDELLAQFEENPSSRPIDRENVFFEEANLLFVFSNDLVDGIALFSGNEILGIELKNEVLIEDYIIEKLGSPEKIGEFQPRPNTFIKYLAYFYDVGGQILRVDFFTYPEGVQPEFMVHVHIFGEDNYPSY